MDVPTSPSSSSPEKAVAATEEAENLLKPSHNNKHAMVLYHTNNNNTYNPNKVVLDHVNEGLRRGHLVICIPFNVEEEDDDGSGDDGDISSNISQGISSSSIKITKILEDIRDYEQHKNQGNILTLGIEGFYKFALDGNYLHPLEELRVLLEEAREERISKDNAVITNSNSTTTNGLSPPPSPSLISNSSPPKKNDGITIVATVAGKLAEDGKFDKSIEVEKWWQKTHSELLKKGLNVTVVCPHPSSITSSSSMRENDENNKKEEFIRNHRNTISALHDVAII